MDKRGSSSYYILNVDFMTDKHLQTDSISLSVVLFSLVSHHHYVYIYEVNNLFISIKSLPLKHSWEESQTMPVKVKGENRVKKTVAIVTHCVQKIWLVQDMICIYLHKGRFHTPEVTASLGFHPLHSQAVNQPTRRLHICLWLNKKTLSSRMGLNETTTITTKDDHLH